MSVLLFSGLFLPSCSPERKLANEYVKNDTARSILLLKPAYIYKTSLKTYILDSLGITDKSLSDSVLLANSDILQYLDDSMFIANYVLGLKKELKKFNFTIYNEDNTADFMETDRNAYLVNVAQIEVEENALPYRDETWIDNIQYYHDQLLNTITVDSWFEISEVNNNKNGRQVYFASDEITDDLKGEFTYDVFTDNVKYFYKIDSLDTDDVYNFAYQLGRTYAAYTFDLLMNKYIQKHLPSGKQPGTYWRFDPVNHDLFPATGDRFVLMDK